MKSAGSLKRPARVSDAIRMRRLSFGLRLAISLVLALAVSGVLVVAVTDSSAERTVAEQALQAHAEDAHAVQRAYEAAETGEVPLDEVDEQLDSLGYRSDTLYVVLIDSRKTAIASTRQGKVGVEYPGPEVAAGLGGDDRAAVRGDGDAKHFALFSPLKLGGRSYVLHTEQRPTHLDVARADARDQAIMSVIFGILLTIPTFYLVGGRSLLRVHGEAVASGLRDGLTGVANHRAFQDEIERAVRTADREQAPVSLAILDIDDFKQANDRFGHRHGDELLSRLAHCFGELRGGDRGFRLGGDEFAVLLPGADGRAARTTLERLATAIAERLDGQTVSIGFVTRVRGNESAEQMWRRADEVLYLAKSRGKGRVVAHANDTEIGFEALLADGERST
jgi:diguanylate cyclase (GGDEF)-like protein